jgi:hypothetical protein
MKDKGWARPKGCESVPPHSPWYFCFVVRLVGTTKRKRKRKRKIKKEMMGSLHKEGTDHDTKLYK